METVYVDSLFFINLVIDYLLLLLSGRVCAARLMRPRIFLGAALGALYAVAVVVPAFEWAANAFFKLAAACLMALVAYGREKGPTLLRCCLVFLALSFAFGGAVYAVSLLSGGALLSPGPIASVSLRVLFLSFAVCYAALSLVFRRAARRREREKAAAELRFRGRSVRLRALRDTGNSLYDPVTNDPVMVAFAGAVAPLFPREAAGLISLPAADAVTALGKTPGLRGVFRLVPFSAVGIDAGLLAAFRPDGLTIDGEAETGVLVAISPTPLSGDGEYEAVI